MHAAVSIIIATTCTTARGEMLWRAINSILNQSWEWTEIIVVVNGKHFDQAVFDAMQATPKVRVLYQVEASLHLALHRGRHEVSTPYFGFLDDDDEYLPGAIRVRINPMISNESIDVVVTNGFRCSESGDQLIFNNLERVNADPLRALLTMNWLASCGGLYRTTSVVPEYFYGLTKYFEWTKVALRLACDKKKIVLKSEPTYRYNVTAGSMSAISESIEYRTEMVRFVESSLNLPLPSDVRRGMREKLSGAHHALTESYMSAGKTQEAWKSHLKSLALPGGLKYLAFSRKLIFPYRK